jgi:hypothetical protein
METAAGRAGAVAAVAKDPLEEVALGSPALTDTAAPVPEAPVYRSN